MSLNVEIGAGLANADSFCSVADADDRMAALGNDIWVPLTTSQKEEALRRATVFMEQVYRSRWQGYRQTAAQALSWPRNGIWVEGFSVDSDTVPSEVRHACADLAFRAAAGDLAPDLERAVIREKVGPIETEYDRASPQTKRFRAIDLMLAPYLKGGSGQVRLVRT
jgi:hypothetical protein